MRDAGEKKEKRKPQPRYHHFILILFFIPFFNPSDEVWTGRGMLSQTAISLHHMRLTHRMARRRGVCREHSQEKEERKKIHNVKSRMGSNCGSLISHKILSAASLHSPSATRLS
ncbi:hypothetical protein ILYODFUR_005002 [Ilyodon furcidens]|uniref:Uncharacterized protein n=1 Tax=Ilyodon furcidens TaxID=33524 RepID=A0ABV0T6M7_9TELE